MDSGTIFNFAPPGRWPHISMHQPIEKYTFNPFNPFNPSTSSDVSEQLFLHTANDGPVRIRYKCLVSSIPRNKTVISQTEL
jgi:hypothetical protein